jgi:hypothetical protein
MSLSFFKEKVEQAQQQSFKTRKKWDKELKSVPAFKDFCWDDIGAVVFSTKTAKEALAFYEGYVEWITNEKGSKAPATVAKAEQIARSNIGWFFGEGLPAKRIALWTEACGASHPVFGTKVPSPEVAFKKGLEMGKKLRAAR